MIKMTRNVDIPGENNLPSLLVMKNVTVIKSGRKILDSVSLSIGQENMLQLSGLTVLGNPLYKDLYSEYHPLAAADGLILNIMGKETWHVFELRKCSNCIWRPPTDLLPPGQCAGCRTLRVFSSIGIYYNHKVTLEMEARAREVLKFLEISTLQTD